MARCGKRRLIEAEAKFIIDRARVMVQEGKGTRGERRYEQRYYWCRRCRAYHTTSQSIAWSET